MRKIILIAAVVAIISACANPISQKKASIKLEVSGELWKCVSSLNDSTSDDKHYVLRTDEDGAAVIIFGDGKHGAIPARGKNIKVTFTTHKRYSGVYLQQGRVLIDDDWNKNNAQSGSFNEHCQ
jgi:hypothetical protein